MLTDTHALGAEFFKQASGTLTQEKTEETLLPAFPETAWRGLFDAYRTANTRATEASDVFHFGALWARSAAMLGRRVHFSYGMDLYPNTYLVCFGPTGDRKTTATRQGASDALGNGLKIISGAGSGEGLADEFSKAPGEGVLIHAEELSQILKPGRWEGSTLIPFLTNCFDCPPRHEMKFRKSPISVECPTPNLLAGVTPSWFWRDFRADDFQGGFGNRMFFLTGSPKPCLPQPEAPVLWPIAKGIEELGRTNPCEARFGGKASELWDKFYRAWYDAETKNDSLFHAAVKRIPAYIIKLAMLYAASEGTLPTIDADQLSAAILVGRYGAECARELLSLQHTGTSQKKELEQRILACVAKESNGVTTKREIYRKLWRHYPDSEAFNRAFDSLLRAGEVFVKPAGRGSFWVSLEPLD
jgi:hypothetical protein